MAYATDAEVRALEGLEDETVFPAALVAEAIAFADLQVDTITGTSWEHKPFTRTLDGNGRQSLHLPSLVFPRSLTAVTIDGAALAPTDWAGWVLTEEGYVLRDTGTFPLRWPGQNVTVSGTAGVTTAPTPDIAWCARTLARQYLLDLVSRVPDRALSIQSDFGQISLAQAGAKGRPTSLPDVNAILMRHVHLV